MLEGFLNVNKPEGISSFDVIRKVKQVLGQVGEDLPKIGHTGTLDPFASGVLVLCFGRKFTKQADKVQSLKKEYIVEIKLGAKSNTYDRTGKIVKTKKSEPVPEEKIKKVLENFKGEIWQTPPIFSAKKIQGRRAYDLARKGEKVNLKKSKVEIYNLEIEKYKYPDLILRVECSKGTYVRSLAHDLGQELKTGAYASGLERTAIGPFKIEKSLKVSDFDLERIKQNLVKTYQT